MGRGSSKMGGSGGGAGGKISGGGVTLDLTDVQTLTEQLEALPLGSQIRRYDDDKTEIRVLKNSDSADDFEPWTVYTFLTGASNPTNVYGASDRGVAGILVAGNTLGSKTSIYRVGL